MTQEANIDHPTQEEVDFAFQEVDTDKSGGLGNNIIILVHCGYRSK